ncbi:phosphohistidine phosphatase SixA [Roseateles asaccharophilus]|uniref:hypothetical protein n=1 Tax=Roseateles asaccharophilus TaxID=582607 RepID=UPI0038369E0B
MSTPTRTFSEADFLEAVMAGNCQLVSELITSRALKHGSDIASNVRNGWRVDRDSFNPLSLAAYCMRLNRADVFRHVLNDPSLGIDLADTLASGRPAYASSQPRARQSLTVLAAQYGCAEGLCLASELEPNNAELTGLHDFLGSAATLHAISLYNAAILGHDSQFECCEHFLKTGAPLNHLDTSTNTAGTLLFGWAWSDDSADRLAKLVDLYVEAGLLDVDKPLEGKWTNKHGPLEDSNWIEGAVPLNVAIIKGNKAGALSLIRHGCDIDAAIPSEFPDLASFARGSAPVTSVGDEMAAELTAAIMNRHLAKAELGDANVTADAKALPRHRRMNI